MFDEFDTDGSDEISQSEFVYALWRVLVSGAEGS